MTAAWFKGAALAAVVAAAPAWAQADRPLTTPTRDVDVVYRASAGGQQVEQRSRFAVQAKKLRIDTPSPGLYVIVDREAKTMDMVSEADRGVVEMPYDPARTVGGVRPDGAYVRGGTDAVAGIPCTEWRTTDSGARPVLVCMTADGVLLRARTGTDVLVQAVRVAYGPIDPGVFRIPPGYARATPPRRP